MRYLEARGAASTNGAKRGDLVVYGHGSHIGIYVVGGNVISALVHGVQRTGVRALTVPFTEYLHTHLAGSTAVHWSHHVTTNAAPAVAGISAPRCRACPASNRWWIR